MTPNHDVGKRAHRRKLAQFIYLPCSENEIQAHMVNLFFNALLPRRWEFRREWTGMIWDGTGTGMPSCIRHAYHKQHQHVYAAMDVHPGAPVTAQ